MRDDSHKRSGIRKLYEKCRKAFRVPENLNHYAPEDYKNAERNFIRRGFFTGCTDLSDSDRSESS